MYQESLLWLSSGLFLYSQGLAFSGCLQIAGAPTFYPSSSVPPEPASQVVVTFFLHYNWRSTKEEQLSLSFITVQLGNSGSACSRVFNIYY